jgi:hypothetical protein
MPKSIGALASEQEIFVQILSARAGPWNHDP